MWFVESALGIAVRIRVGAITHPWCDSHFISACGVWEVRVGVQVSGREFHIHIHLD